MTWLQDALGVDNLAEIFETPQAKAMTSVVALFVALFLALDVAKHTGSGVTYTPLALTLSLTWNFVRNVLAGLLLIYTTHCFVSGKCNVYAWFLVFWIFLLNAWMYYDEIKPYLPEWLGKEPEYKPE